MDINHIKRAVDEVGSQSALAKAINVAPQFVNQWTTGRRPVPVKHALAIEAITGVTRYDLRPDVFGPAPEVHTQRRRSKAVEGEAAEADGAETSLSEVA